MKQTLNKITEENQAQHAALGERIKKIEEQPGEKWNKATWAILVALISAAVGVVVGKLLV